MKKRYILTLGLLTGIIAMLAGHAAASFQPISIPAGGTGKTSFIANRLVYGNFNQVSTTTASCSGLTSCSTFTVLGSSPITINSVGSVFPFTPKSYGVSTSTTIGFLNGLFSTASSTFTSTLNLSALTQGSILFSGAAGLVSQDNANLFWDSTNHRLGIGTSTPQYPLSIFSTSNPQLALTNGAGKTQWTLRNANGTLYFATTTVSGLATSTNAALTINIKHQILAQYGDVSNTTPAFGFIGNTGTGISSTNGQQVNAIVGGVRAGSFSITTSVAQIAATSASTAALPSFVSITGSGNSGIFFPTGVNQVGISTNGKEVARFDASQRLGIGSTTPWAKLSLVGSTTPIFAIATSTTGISSTPVFEIDKNGHMISSGPKPASASGNCTNVVGNDNDFRTKTATSQTTCTINFANSWGTNAPICIANEESAGTIVAEASSTPSTVVLTFASALTTKSIAVSCRGIQ